MAGTSRGLGKLPRVASLSDLPLRDDLKGASPYGAPLDPVRYALNVNENTHPIPEAVARDIVERLAHAVLGANRYPDREFSELRAAFAGYLGHGLGAQSDEMRRYCLANELQLLAVTYDVMSSGSVSKLFGRQTAVAAIESGMADGLLVRALDRTRAGASGG